MQIREKDLASKELLDLVCDAMETASRGEPESGVQRSRIIVNDRLDIAVAAKAAGVHLGRQSLPVGEVSAWRREGNAAADFLIGVSCHSLAQAQEAETNGADYLCFGPVFETPEKLKWGSPQGLEKLGQVCRSAKIPVVAIGGVNAENAKDCLRAGASGIAAIRLFQEARREAELRETVLRLHRFS